MKLFFVCYWNICKLLSLKTTFSDMPHWKVFFISCNERDHLQFCLLLQFFDWILELFRLLFLFFILFYNFQNSHGHIYALLRTIIPQNSERKIIELLSLYIISHNNDSKEALYIVLLYNLEWANNVYLYLTICLLKKKNEKWKIVDDLFHYKIWKRLFNVACLKMLSLSLVTYKCFSNRQKKVSSTIFLSKFRCNKHFSLSKLKLIG
jgi:hypothetical protein